MKELKANRQPPGDRWTLVDDGEQIYPSLTDALNQIYMVTGLTQFYIDAGKGEIHAEDGKEKPEQIKKYSLYGEEY
jgi:hypothetical protein